MITGIASLIQRVAVYESTPGLAQRRDQEIDVKITFSPRSEITRAGWKAGEWVVWRGELHLQQQPCVCCCLMLWKSRSDPCGAADGSSPRPRQRGRQASTSDAGRHLFSKRGVKELFLIKRQSGRGEDQSPAAAIRLPLPLECQGAGLVIAPMCHWLRFHHL